MKNYKTLYDTLSDSEKLDLLHKLYTKEKRSFADIAEIYGTYANRIRRDAKKLNIEIRDKSTAQKNALSTGRHKHPTKGTIRSEDTKNKIGKSVMNSWDKLSETELQLRKQKSKDNWDKLSNDEKQYRQKAASQAVRISSKIGSKLEKHLLASLIDHGYKVDFHKEHSLVNTKLQIDLFLPTMNIAIEVDGPSHFLPVWGDDTLQKNIVYDKKKEGLILGKGWHLIRIKQIKDFSKTRANLISCRLIESIKEIANQKFKVAQKITIED